MPQEENKVEEWEEKIRNDYDSILSEEQINATIAYWKSILAEKEREGNAKSIIAYDKGYENGKLNAMPAFLAIGEEMKTKIKTDFLKEILNARPDFNSEEWLKIKEHILSNAKKQGIIIEE